MTKASFRCASAMTFLIAAGVSLQALSVCGEEDNKKWNKCVIRFQKETGLDSHFNGRAEYRRAMRNRFTKYHPDKCSSKPCKNTFMFARACADILVDQPCLESFRAMPKTEKQAPRPEPKPEPKQQPKADTQVKAAQVCLMFNKVQCNMANVCTWDDNTGFCRANPTFSAFSAPLAQWMKYVESVFEAARAKQHAKSDLDLLQEILNDYKGRDKSQSGPAWIMQRVSIGLLYTLAGLYSYATSDSEGK